MISRTTSGTRVYKFHSAARALATTLLLLATGADAATADKEPTTFWKRLDEKGIYERIWERLRLYENETNSFLQSFSVIGRYQGQYWSVDSEEGSADNWEHRRIFLGAEALLLRQFTLHGQIFVNEDADPFYGGLFQAFVEWAPSEAFKLSAGRVDAQFTGLERSTSSTKTATFERGLLVNQMFPQQVVGALVEGEPGDVSYQAGIYSGSIEEEFTAFEGGFGAMAGIGYHLPLFYETGRIHLDYEFNNGNRSNNALQPYDHVFSLWHQGQSGPFGLGVDLTWAHGLESRPAVFGVTVLPTYVFAKHVIRKGDALQVVLRYQFAVSDADNGLQLQSRYERQVVPGAFGDRYHAVYGGINYLVFGDRFKLMTGAEYSAMHDSARDGGHFAGWTFLTGVRVYF